MFASAVRLGDFFFLLNHFKNAFNSFNVSATATALEHKLYNFQPVHDWSQETLPLSGNATTLCGFSEELLCTIKVGTSLEPVGIFMT